MMKPITRRTSEMSIPLVMVSDRNEGGKQRRRFTIPAASVAHNISMFPNRKSRITLRFARVVRSACMKLIF